MQALIGLNVKKLDPSCQVPKEILSDYISECTPGNEENIPPCDTVSSFVPRNLTSQAEDFGGSLALPHYGFRRPSADYFNSNLILHNFVISDVTNGHSNIYYYDERAQDKGAEALCTLRMRYHLLKQDLGLTT